MSQVTGTEPTASVSAGHHRITDFVIHGNLHIVLVALGLMMGTYLLADIPLNIHLLVAGSCGAFLVYQIDRLFVGGEEDELNHPLRTRWIDQHRSLMLGTCLLFLILGLSAATNLSSKTLIAGIGLAVIGVVYLLPILPDEGRLKSIWFVKPMMIAGAWSIGSVVFPALDVNLQFDGEIWGLLIYRWLFILPNVFLSDWADQKGDALAGLTSLATLLGEGGVRLVAGMCAAASVVAGLVLGFVADWPLLYYVDLGGPLLMIIVCCRPFSLSNRLFVFWLDMLVAWPLLIAFLAWLI